MRLNITNRVNLPEDKLALATKILGRNVRGLVLGDINQDIERLVTDPVVQPHIMKMPEMKRIRGVQVCPIAYALALHAGYNPAMIMLLDLVDQEAGIQLTGWPDKLVITSGDTKDDVAGLLAPGMLWRVGPLSDMAEIWMKPEHAGLPETILARLPERFTGRPLREMVSHPVTDRYDIRIREFVCVGDGDWTISIEGVPPLTTLGDVIREGMDQKS